MPLGVQRLGQSFLGTLRARLHRYFINKGLLCYCTDVTDTARIAVPHNEDLQYQLIFEAHDTALSGHLGRERSTAL